MGQRQPCYRCGRHNHSHRDCKFNDAICHFYGKKGRLSRPQPSKRPPAPPIARRKPNVHQVTADTATTAETTADAAPIDRTSTVEEDELYLYTIGQSSRKQPPIQYQLQLDGKLLWMDLDTGAEVSVIPESVYKSIFRNKQLVKSSFQLKTYLGDSIPVAGEIEVEVKSQSQIAQAVRFVVVTTNGPTLIGRDLLMKIGLDWSQINRASDTLTLPSVLELYKSVFEDRLGMVNFHRAKLLLRSSSSPKFCKPRPIPFAIKELVGKELDRLEEAGILEKVSHSEWASPIMTVPKKDGSYKICGDYKVTVNPTLETDQYPYQIQSTYSLH